VCGHTKLRRHTHMCGWRHLPRHADLRRINNLRHGADLRRGHMRRKSDLRRGDDVSGFIHMSGSADLPWGRNVRRDLLLSRHPNLLG